MKITRIATLILLIFLLSACATHSGNMRIGTEQSYTSLTDQREAIKAVQVYPKIPDGAVSMGKVDASRCHRNTSHAEPDDEMVLVDLKVTAYARGADGLTDVNITKQSGLSQNCWYIITGDAVMFQWKSKQ
ncbi:MAG: hypothetical protein WC373_13380 [Smithella sp.]|jgi:Flp pilus assembly protein TadD